MATPNHWEHFKAGQKSRMILAECPYCGSIAPHQHFDAIDVSVNPEMVRDICIGKIWETECTGCGNAFSFSHDFLYVNSESKIAVQLMNDADEVIRSNQEPRRQVIERFIPDLAEQNYVFRIVPTFELFVDKIMILETGLDDRIMEIYKWGEIAMYYEDHPEAMEQGIQMIKFFVRTELNGGRFFVRVNDKFVKDEEFDRGLYDYLVSQYGDKLPAMTEELPFVYFEDLCDRFSEQEDCAG